MTLFEDLNIDPDDNAEKLAAFQQFSRQMLYMVLFQNEALQFSVFEEDLSGTDLSQEAGAGQGGSPGDDSELKQQQILKELGRYLHSQMLDEFDDPDQFSIDEWVEMARQVQTKPKDQQKDLRVLSLEIYRLLKQELTLERERQIRSNTW